MNINGDIKSIVVPIVSLLVGAAIVYGTMKESVNVLKRDSQDNKMYVRQIDQRLSRIEGALKLNVQMFDHNPLGIQHKED